MKRILFYLGVVAVVGCMMTSCAATKRDCQGAKHYRLKNGIYL